MDGEIDGGGIGNVAIKILDGVDEAVGEVFRAVVGVTDGAIAVDEQCAETGCVEDLDGVGIDATFPIGVVFNQVDGEVAAFIECCGVVDGDRGSVVDGLDGEIDGGLVGDVTVGIFDGVSEAVIEIFRVVVGVTDGAVVVDGE